MPVTVLAAHKVTSWLCTLLTIGCASTSITGAASVYDGDTLYINSQAIRLAGIDAEELDEPNGYAAKAHLILLIRGRSVTCSLGGWSYQRRVGVCYAGSKDSLNAQMIRDGYALDCAHYSNGLYATLAPAGARQRLKQKGYCR